MLCYSFTLRVKHVQYHCLLTSRAAPGFGKGESSGGLGDGSLSAGSRGKSTISGLGDFVQQKANDRLRIILVM